MSTPFPPSRDARRPVLRLSRSYEETLLMLTEEEARLVLRLDPDDFWAWYEGRAEPSGSSSEARP